MDNKYLNGLNNSQLQAVENTDGPVLVIAGAGSGKTRVLTIRIAHLMKKGIPPSSILALTFTNKAAKEMKDRIARIVGGDIAKYLWMGTFHSIFARILRNESEAIGFPTSFTIYDTSDSKSLIKSIIKELDFDDKTYKPGAIQSRISYAKNNLITPQKYIENKSATDYDKSVQMPRFIDVYKEYVKKCKIAGAMDFDDLLLYTNQLFHQFPEILSKYQNRFSHILVDEYQDTNYAQYLIVKKLAEKNKNICVVGDDAQSIYSFRGARIENILNFKNDYPDYKSYKLERNYRSTQTIVNAANSIISKNINRINKVVYSENESGSRIKVLEAASDTEEGIIVANEINQNRFLDQQQFSDYAILYRLNAQSRIFEEQLRKLNLPYRVFGGTSFYERKEIKDIIAYLRLTVNFRDNEAFKRIVNYPARGIGDTTLNKLELYASQQDKTIWEISSGLELNNINFNKGTTSKIISFVNLIQEFKDMLNEATAYEIALAIARKTGILEDLYRDKTPENLSKFENIQELLNAIQDFTISAIEEDRPHKLENYLEEVSLLTTQDNEDDDNKNKITLMSVHSAKGLEFKNVFIVGMEENLFPSSMNGFMSPESLEEERRLFYVALTRAMKNVWITYARQRFKWGQFSFCEQSRFISEIDERYLILPITSNLRYSIRENPGHGLFERSISRTTIQSTPPVRSSSVSVTSSLSNRFSKVNASDENYRQDSIEIIQIGDEVEHQRFGRGKVLELEGDDSNKKATVLFQNAGRKQLLLKFAKLKIIK
ncbi:MAG: UvrD-helicase domain-containing protein [Prolixibacteraceae bacterium]|nr:UvrD-helicase domain-containing protein [Prolixibacteraceae bacterium]